MSVVFFERGKDRELNQPLLEPLNPSSWPCKVALYVDFVVVVTLGESGRVWELL